MTGAAPLRLSPAHWKRGLRRIAGGVYTDQRGPLHLDMAELLRSNGYIPTSENVETMLSVAQEMAREMNAELHVVETGPTPH